MERSVEQRESAHLRRLDIRQQHPARTHPNLFQCFLHAARAFDGVAGFVQLRHRLLDRIGFASDHANR
jgi:hypothetical protein